MELDFLEKLVVFINEVIERINACGKPVIAMIFHLESVEIVERFLDVQCMRHQQLHLVDIKEVIYYIQDENIVEILNWYP